MNITINKSVTVVVALFLALFTPMVELAFKVLGLVLGAINPVGMAVVILVGVAFFVLKAMRFLNQEEGTKPVITVVKRDRFSTEDPFQAPVVRRDRFSA